jgi:pimeloyl-ACP methyl ester carboxylesterase
VPEHSHQQPSQEYTHAFSIGIHDVLTVPPHEGELGNGLLLRTDRGDIQAIMHQSPDSQRGVIWVGGARGGFGGPGKGAYARLSEVLRRERISSLRMSYRHPNVLPECVLDIMAGVAYLKYCSYQPVILVGHSFGGAVVIAAGAMNDHVAGVVALSPQTYGANLAGRLAPRPLLVVHGKADTRLPYSCGVQIYHWAHEPKQLVLYEGAEHRLEECAAELEQLLTQWIPGTLSLSGLLPRGT